MRGKALAAAAVLAGMLSCGVMLPPPASAQGAARQQPAFKPSKTWQDIAGLCRAQSKARANSTALEIGRHARDEYYRFGGHRIDANGRLFSFGVVESEQEEDAQNIQDGKYRLSYLGWWNVLGYWAKLGENASVVDAARNFLRLKGYKDATGRLVDSETQPLPSLRMGEALAAVDKLIAGMPARTPDELEKARTLKEILTEALIRAAANDVAWSAAFVSSVMRMAGLKPDQFEYSDSHQAYIHKSVDTSVADAEPGAGATQQFYRACPPSAARLRVGDLVCYHRVKKLDAVSRAELREMALEDRGKPLHERRIKASHCDVVAHIDTRRSVAYVVGGNVQQSVTVKQVVLRRGSSTLEEQQPDGCKRGPSWTLPAPSPGLTKAPHLGEECSLNRKPWFVVLQVR